MNLPTDLAREVSERAVQPGFDAVVDRAQHARRRRRTTIASAVATVAVVGGLAWGLAPGQHTGDPQPASPSPTTKALTGEIDPRLPADVRDVLGSEWLHSFGIAGSGGAIATIWGACEPTGTGCRFALVTRLGDQVTGSMLTDGAPDLQEVPGGWMVTDGSGTFVASADGERTPVIDPGGNVVPAEAGDVVVHRPDGLRLLRGTKLLPLPTPVGGVAMDAYATPVGDLVVAELTEAGDVQVSWSEDGIAWRPGYLSRAGTGSVSTVLMTGHHDDVAVVLLGDDPDGSVPVLDVGVSHDAGRTWVRARGLEALDGIADISGVAVSDEGSTYVTTGSHGLVRMDAEGNVLVTPLSSFDHSAFLVSHRICVATEAGRVDVLQCTADDGTTWAPQPLPGFG